MKRLLSKIAITVVMACAGFNVQAAEKHLFYIHGCCIDKVGTDGYETIVKDLQSAGFNVVFEVRRDDSTGAVEAYAAKVAEQVKGLIAKGAAPEDITVAGYSLGSITTMMAAVAIANPKVNYVLLAGCPGPRARSFNLDYTKVQGRVLSLVDERDDRFGPCKSRLPENALQKEVEFDSGSGHAIFRYTTDKAYQLWKEPLVAWAKGQ